jgi:hypothetical protein
VRKLGALLLAMSAAALPAAAHHSFAIYDMDQDINFDGVVESVKLRNPHMALTLKVTKGDGTTGIVNFVEGAPINMIVRLGLDTADIAVGKPIKTVGAPRRDDPHAYFLKAIILPDGRRYSVIN